MDASIIIPTHNRSASLKEMLKQLEMQTYPKEHFEVIVVADGCRDNTVEIVKSYQSGYRLLLCELKGLGAATARNTGASKASGKILIFADDDMEPSVDFITKHVTAHTNENKVVIGYSPFKLETKASIQRITLREWWENKFQAMRKKDHRYKYDDLTSGNFSISSSLFKKLNGFDTSLLCREDYELGFRLIKAGAEFYFAYPAKAFHRDEVTDLLRSLQRKKTEGLADMQIKKLHPDFINKEAVFYLSQRSFSKSVLLKAIQFAPSFFDAIADLATSAMRYFEKFKMRSSWLTTNYRLHQYWYLRGLMQSVASSKELYQFIYADRKPKIEKEKLKIDMREGLKNIETNIDQTRPMEMDVYYGTKFIGNIGYEPGSEPMKGIHLRRLLKENFSEELYNVLKDEVQIFKDVSK